MVVELHLLQNFSPSCLNRDDTNAPKDCEFGGVRRARLSSQCLKRAIRWSPEFASLPQARVGVRTKRLTEALCAQLSLRNCADPPVTDVAAAVLTALVGQLGSQGRTRALIHLGHDELARVADLIAGRWDDLVAAAALEALPALRTAYADSRRHKSALQKLAAEVAGSFTPGSVAPDIALFGRMVAENANLNVDAACQVAHALSTHRVVMELDFFTAADDLRLREQPGAEMMGTVEFSSACFYRYAVVSLEQLLRNLGDDAELTALTVEGFLAASVAAIPSGRQSTMAAHNPPSLVLAVVRAWGPPWSLANAFESPVRVVEAERFGGGRPAPHSSLVGQSLTALDRYWGQLARMYGEDTVVARPASWLEDADVEFLNDQRLP
ncbi:MAG: type I-E CRISPR-associated protein Cas7/Cse4/CasC, partial [Armatimonadota bacterium]